MKLKTGPGPAELESSRTPAALRSTAWAHSSAPAKRSGPTSIRRHTLPVGPDDYKKIDPKKLAAELEVDMCAGQLAAASG